MKNLEARRRIRRHQKQRARGQIQALHDELHERFPHAFLRQPDKVAPLKKGIYHDIKEALADRTYSTRIIGWTLRRYTQRHAYLRALAERKPRIDLSGQAVDTVTEEEQQQAMAQLNAMRRRRGKPPQATRATEQA